MGGTAGSGGTADSGGSGGEMMPGTGCLDESTLVATDQGSRPIGDLRPGELVWSVDLESGQLRLNPVTWTRSVPGQLRTLELQDGTRIRATGSHPFYDAARGEFVAADELASDALLLEPPASCLRPQALSSYAPGDASCTTDEQRDTAAVRTFEASASGMVVDLTVARDHNFIAGGVVVHNKTGGSPPCFSDLPQVLEASGSLTWTTSGNAAIGYRAPTGHGGQGGAGSLGGSAGFAGSAAALAASTIHVSTSCGTVVSVEGEETWQYAVASADSGWPPAEETDWQQVDYPTRSFYQQWLYLRFPPETQCVVVGPNRNDACAEYH